MRRDLIFSPGSGSGAADSVPIRGSYLHVISMYIYTYNVDNLEWK